MSKILYLITIQYVTEEEKMHFFCRDENGPVFFSVVHNPVFYVNFNEQTKNRLENYKK